MLNGQQRILALADEAEDRQLITCQGQKEEGVMVHSLYYLDLRSLLFFLFSGDGAGGVSSTANVAFFIRLYEVSIIHLLLFQMTGHSNTHSSKLIAVKEDIFENSVRKHYTLCFCDSLSSY